MNAASSGDVHISRADQLTPDEVRAVLTLTESAGRADGAAPVSEHVLLSLRQPRSEATTHLIAREPGGPPVGYAHLDISPGPRGFSAELVVHPQNRRRGLGRSLVEAVLAAAGGASPATGTTLGVWAHGDHPSAAAIALDLGFRRDRVLWQLRRPLTGDLVGPELPTGVTLRPFAPGADDAAWLALNARAFASHPEQGRWTIADLHARMAEPWFDPSGFLLATADDGRLLGFHWTKVHPPATDHGRSMGEVYVLGVDPDTHGLGLGKALTLAGLTHLRDRGLPRVMLYVDESNAPAMRLYQRLGFGSWSAHVTWRRPVTG
ncbi:mycothiol synthase [Plantactinospora sp. GCM10030261]|uniref:mycothiol synthase n=1 Tax=Plantactinospora sp. GCM10030261 TaxID=3273420 RepID=UPI00360C28E8